MLSQGRGHGGGALGRDSTCLSEKLLGRFRHEPNHAWERMSRKPVGKPKTICHKVGCRCLGHTEPTSPSKVQKHAMAENGVCPYAKMSKERQTFGKCIKAAAENKRVVVWESMLPRTKKSAQQSRKQACTYAHVLSCPKLSKANQGLYSATPPCLSQLVVLQKPKLSEGNQVLCCLSRSYR